MVAEDSIWIIPIRNAWLAYARPKYSPASWHSCKPLYADGHPTGMVFNMAYGIQGECRYTHVPAMLEMAGVPYTGSRPLGHALALDKVITKNLLRDAGIPTPNFCVMRRGTESARISVFRWL